MMKSFAVARKKSESLAVRVGHVEMAIVQELAVGTSIGRIEAARPRFEGPHLFEHNFLVDASKTFCPDQPQLPHPSLLLQTKRTELSVNLLTVIIQRFTKPVTILRSSKSPPSSTCRSMLRRPSSSWLPRKSSESTSEVLPAANQAKLPTCHARFTNQLAMNIRQYKREENRFQLAANLAEKIMKNQA